jgi:hypothetical protein
MKRMSSLFASVFLPLVAACSSAAPGDPSATSAAGESASTHAHWAAFYSCDDGSVLDVNVDERREIQFVVRNDDAKDLLMKAYDPQYFDWNISPRGELIFLGRLEHGLFNAGDFSRAVAISGKPKQQTGDEWGPTVEITRSGSDITLVADEYRNWTFRGCN